MTREAARIPDEQNSRMEVTDMTTDEVDARLLGERLERAADAVDATTGYLEAIILSMVGALTRIEEARAALPADDDAQPMLDELVDALDMRWTLRRHANRAEALHATLAGRADSLAGAR